ncbi:MAG: DUF3048 domain-containing protein [Nocardioides sp.]|nr:DUF3048 domain-containing protein [Nocardioides sp.]
MRLSRPRNRLLLQVAAPLVVLGLALTGCGGEPKRPAASPSPSAPPKPDHEPLTGVQLPLGTSAATKHPVYIVKIDNTAQSDPQAGIGSADLVVQELVEGGITRLAVMYYSQLPQSAGPVRSMRATDAGIAAPTGAKIITSGAAPYTIAELKKSHVQWLDMSTPYAVREPGGPYDYLHSVVGKVAKAAADSERKWKGAPKRPADFMPWGPATPIAGKPANEVAVRFSAARTDDWLFRGGKYHLTNSHMAKKSTFVADTVVVAQVTTSIAPYLDPGGSQVPVSHFTGQGKAWIMHNGKIEQVLWHKNGEAGAVTFTDAAGRPIRIPAGKLWLDLIPAGNRTVAPGSVSVTKPAT